jgi:hypothetical protein
MNHGVSADKQRRQLEDAKGDLLVEAGDEITAKILASAEKKA